MDKSVRRRRSLRGEVSPPGDKSISHRAAILNSIAAGEARIANYSPGEDCHATVLCLRALGVEIGEEGDVLTVSGVGKEGFSEPGDVLNAANSGTTMRLLAGLLAAQPFMSVLTGDESLRSRPMARIVHPLRMMGAEVWGREFDSLAPLAIKGNRLQGIDYRLPVASAQLKSAVLIAALFAEGRTTVEEPAPSRDHTERLLKAMGAHVDCDGPRISLVPPDSLSPVDLRVPGDISATACWLVAAAIHPNARVEVLGTGVNPSRTGILEVLRRMGAKIEVRNERTEGGEPVADVRAESSTLTGTKVAEDLVPRVIDEIPLIALAACFAEGTTTIRNAEELRVKETDRIAATVAELSKLGADIEELPDGMVVRGGGELAGGVCHSHRDHRMAMVLGIAGVVSRGRTVVRDAEAVGVSYPAFWDDLDRLTKSERGKGTRRPRK